MKNKFKEDLLEVLKNLRCIDSIGDLQVDSYVDESIEILKKIINDIETAPEVPVQEQLNKTNENHINSTDFEKIIALSNIVTGPLDFSKKFKTVLEYDPEWPTVKLEHFKA